MHQLLHDNFWIYVCVIVVLTVAVFYYTPMAAEFLWNKVTRTRKKTTTSKNAPDNTAEKSRRRYKTF